MHVISTSIFVQYFTVRVFRLCTNKSFPDGTMHQLLPLPVKIYGPGHGDYKSAKVVLP